VAQWHVDEDAASSPFGLNRWLDWGIYHAGGLDSLLGATRWVQSPAEQDDYAATELFFVRDHLGSPALAMQAKRTLVSGSTYRWELQPVESYEYAPYGDPTIHVPATDGSPQSAGRLAPKELESFAMTGAKSTESLLDRNDVGRPNGSSGNTWTRNGSVPVAKSCLGWSHLFTGRPWDADVRQYYIRHRWYEPLTGRWTAVDPIGYSGGLNQYQYCGGNGVNFADLTGLKLRVGCTMPRVRDAIEKDLDDLVGGLGVELDDRGMVHFVQGPLLPGQEPYPFSFSLVQGLVDSDLDHRIDIHATARKDDSARPNLRGGPHPNGLGGFGFSGQVDYDEKQDIFKPFCLLPDGSRDFYLEEPRWTSGSCSA